MAWFNYDDTFRRDPAARSITGWSNIHLELFAFYTSTPTTPSTPTPSGPTDFDSSGSPSSRFDGHSCNSGRCSARFRVCRYAHVCDNPGCRGVHPRSSCPLRNFSRPAGVQSESILPVVDISTKR